MTPDQIKDQRDWLDTLTGYTDGEWRIGRLESWELDGTAFRRVYFPGDDPCEAHVRGQDCDENASLIAAAPDLRDRYAAALDEVERLREAHREVVEHCRNTGRGSDLVNERIIERCEATAMEALKGSDQ